MDISAFHPSIYLEGAAQAPCGPFATRFQLQAPSVCFPGTRPPSLVRGCAYTIVGRSIIIRLPPIPFQRTLSSETALRELLV